MRQIISQLRLHLRIEYRSWPQIASLLLFMWCLAYVVYRIRPEINPEDFNFLFWIIMMLTSISVAIRSTAHARHAERIFMYTLVSPGVALFGLILFNALYLIAVGTAFYLAMLILFYPQVHFTLDYFLLVVIGSMVLGVILSFVSAISRYLDGQHTALSILSIPLLIPTLIIVYGLGSNMIQGQQAGGQYVILVGLGLASSALAIVLFPYLWRE